MGTRLKLLYVSNWLGTGGIETNLVLLTRELTKRGHQVLVASRGGDLVESFQQAGGKHIELDLAIGPHSLAGASRGLASVVAAERPDIMHVFSATTAVASLCAGGIARARRGYWPPVVSSVMGLQKKPDEWLAETYLRVFMTTWGARRTLIIAPAIGDILRRLPIRRTRLRECQVVGIDPRFAARTTPETTARFRKELDLEGKRVVSTIGNLAPRKSHELFVRAAASIAARFPDVVFLIAGEGDRKEALESEIKERGLVDRVRLIGQRNDTPDLLSATTVYVKPGVVEGFVGITVLEAQLIGCPVVAFDTKDVRLAIDDGITGLIVPRNDTERLGETIAKLLSDRDFAAEIALAGQRAVVERFSIAAVVDQLETQYRQLME